MCFLHFSPRYFAAPAETTGKKMKKVKFGTDFGSHVGCKVVF